MLEGTRYRITTTDDERARVVVIALFSNEMGKASRDEIAISQYESTYTANVSRRQPRERRYRQGVNTC